MKPRSNCLFHLTNKLETLKKILNHGFWPRYVLEDVRWLQYKKIEYTAFPVVCFCDIPLSRINEHVSFYGSYGLGMTKEWALKNKLNPVLYVSGENDLKKSIIGIAHLVSTINDARHHNYNDILHYFRYLVSFSKPISGNMMSDGHMVEKDFYQEAEWRYVPEHSTIEDNIGKSKFINKAEMNRLNELTRMNCSLTFRPNDIRYIFVKSESDIPDIFDFIQTQNICYSKEEIKILMTRIISISDIVADV